MSHNIIHGTPYAGEGYGNVEISVSRHDSDPTDITYSITKRAYFKMGRIESKQHGELVEERVYVTQAQAVEISGAIYTLEKMAREDAIAKERAAHESDEAYEEHLKQNLIKHGIVP